MAFAAQIREHRCVGSPSWEARHLLSLRPLYGPPYHPEQVPREVRFRLLPEHSECGSLTRDSAERAEGEDRTLRSEPAHAADHLEQECSLSAHPTWRLPESTLEEPADLRLRLLQQSHQHRTREGGKACFLRLLEQSRGPRMDSPELSFPTEISWDRPAHRNQLG